MGQVFLGVSPGGRPVAVKAIRAELAADPQFRERFAREVAAARRVSGLFTAMVVDADVDGPVAWLATAYVPGLSLAEAVDRHGPLPEASLLGLAAGLAESLNAIHVSGVVHRDLKPSNVLLAEDGPRVIDFGISRAAESSTLTQTGLVVGSPGFMSPEQAIGGVVGPPSDIFSLGAVLAFAATGQGPFGSGTTATLLYRVVHETADLGRVPATVRPLIERCLRKDPAQRPIAAGVIAEVGALHSTDNWLPDSIIRMFDASSVPPTVLEAGLAATQTAQDRSAAARPGWDSEPWAAAAGYPLPLGGVTPPPTLRPGQMLVPGETGPRGSRPPRRGPLRPLVLGWLIGGLVVASAVTAFALTASGGHSPTPPLRSQPAAQTSALTSAGGKTASAAASHHATSPATATGPATAAGQPTATSSSASATASPTHAASASSSASATATATGSATATATASASATATATASATASASPSTGGGSSSASAPASTGPTTPAATTPTGSP
jgi:hypothetical protein